MTSLNSCLSFGHFIFVDSWPWNCLACCCRRRVQGSIPFWLAILVSHAKIAGQLPILYIKHCLVGGFNPSEKYVSQIGSSSQLLGKIIQMFQTTNQVYIVLTILRNMKVNGKDYPYMKWKNKSHVPNHQPELVSWDYYSQYMENESNCSKPPTRNNPLYVYDVVGLANSSLFLGYIVYTPTFWFASIMCNPNSGRMPIFSEQHQPINR